MKKLILLSALLFVATACNNSTPPKTTTSNGPSQQQRSRISESKTDSSLYTNTKYGFQISLPEGWIANEPPGGLVFYSKTDQEKLAQHNEQCKNEECMGAYYPSGVMFKQGYSDTVVEERGMTKINGVDWRVRVYDASGLGMVVYEATLNNKAYAFYEFYSYDKESSDNHKFETLLKTFKAF